MLRLHLLAGLAPQADELGRGFEHGQTREEIKSDHVLAIATKWLAWVEAE